MKGVSKIPIVFHSDSEYLYAKKIYEAVISSCPDYLLDSSRNNENIYGICCSKLEELNTALIKYQQLKESNEESESEEKPNKSEQISELSDKICSDMEMLKGINEQLAYEDQVEEAGGVRDLQTRRSMAEAKVMANMTIKNEKAEYKKLTGKSWVSSNCNKQNDK